MTRAVLAACFCIVASTLCAEAPVQTVEFTCERGALIRAAYVGQGDSASIVLSVDGRQFELPVARSGSGIRFADPGSGYVWHEKGTAAILCREEETSARTIYADCRTG